MNAEDEEDINENESIDGNDDVDVDPDADADAGLDDQEEIEDDDNEGLSSGDEFEENENENIQENINNSNEEENSLFNFSKNNFNNIDLENNDSIEFLQKFNKEYKSDYIASNHQESLNKNYNEIKKLILIKKDNNNNIIDPLHKTIPILSKYEKTKIIGIRLKQLNNGSKPYIVISDTILDNNIIVNMEIQQKVLPFIISRPLPNNTCEYWKLQDLELIH